MKKSGVIDDGNENFDTILWEKESNKFSKRAIKKFKDIDTLFNMPERTSLISTLVDELLRIPFIPKAILDFGCGTGGYLKLFHDKFPNADLFGIDPGDFSINIAKKYFSRQNIKVNLSVDHGHSLKNQRSSIDLLTLFKVLQWIPRAYLIATMAEIDRVLKTNGFIVISEYLPKKPMFRQSKHNQSVYIFKQNYSKLFEAFPWYKVVYAKTYHLEKHDDYIENLTILKKIPVRDAYHKRNTSDI